MTEQIKLPRFVTAHPDRHGTVRYRFRRKGFASHYFVARPGTLAFRAEYDRCLDGEKPPSRYALSTPDRRLRSRQLREVVYFIGGAEGPVKIGSTVDVVKRLATLQTAHPQPLSVLATSRGGIAVEREYHQRFAAFRLRGEWFERAPEVATEMVRLNALTSNRNGGGV